MGIIHIQDLSVRAIIGANSWERTNKQDLVIGIILEYDSTKAAKTDALSDALDYEVLSKKVIKLVEGSRCLLLEKLAAKVLTAVMADARVEWASVKLDKPHAIAQAKCVSLELSRQR